MMKTLFSKGNSVQKMLFLGLFVATFLISSTTSIVVAQGVTPDHVAKMKSVTSSAISNDGNFVAYTVSVPADAFKENSTNATHFYVLNTATGESKPYFTSSSVSQVQFRPGKGTLTFLTRQSGDSSNALYELSLTGG